jgi:type IV pilus assembly protein PilQ
MLGIRSGRFHLAGVLACAALLAVGSAGCAGSGSGTAGASAIDQGVSDVQISHDGADTIVTLIGPDHPVFTAFGQPNPERVIIDLSASSDVALAPVMVNDGLVAEVSVSPYSIGTGDEMTRIEVLLDAPAEHEVTTVADGLKVRITPSGDTAALDTQADWAGDSSEDAYDPWAASDAETSGDQMSETAGASATTPAAEPTPATEFTGVDVEETADGILVKLRANGLISSVSTFTLDDPARLVVDLLDLKNGSSQATRELNSPFISRIRVGEHPDKIRVVIDGGSTAEPFDGRRVVPTSAGLVVALGHGGEIDAALALATEPATKPVVTAQTEVAETAASDAEQATGSAFDADATEIAQSDADSTATGNEPMDAPAAEPEDSTPSDAASNASQSSSALAAIYGVEFDNQDNRDRIVVLGDMPVEYKLYEPSPETLIISLEDAKIDPEAAVRITPEPGGPVSLVSAFEQPDVEEPEVRLVVQRAANLVPEISRRGSLLIVDFPHTGLKAAAPPAMTQEEAMGAQANLEGVPATNPKAMASAADSDAGQSPGADRAADSTPAAMEPESSIDVLEPGGLSPDKQYRGRRISLDFKDVDIADVLRLIAEVSELNVIAGDEVKGKVTVRLVDVPWDQALDVVLLTKGLGFMRVGNILRIAPSVEIKQEEEMRLQERRSKERLEDLVVKLQPVNFADVKQVSKMVQQLLTPDRGTVTVDDRTSTLIIKDIPSVIAEATALIKAIDTQTPQVMIEAKIVEASLDFSREFGVVWALGARSDAMPNSWLYSPNTGDNLMPASGGPFNQQNPIPITGGGGAFNPLTANPTGLLGLTGSILNDTFNVDLQLQAAEVNGDGKVISSPRVVTLDNSKASIQQGVSIPFQTFENGDAQLEFVDAVLKLEVTPHITANKSIIMKVDVTRNAPDDSVFTLTGSPAIAKNQVKTETLVKDGQTLVLGGIYVVDKSERQSRVPYLHKIPVLGALFRSDEKSDSRKELLIFVTPSVVAPGDEDA